MPQRRYARVRRPRARGPVVYVLGVAFAWLLVIGCCLSIVVKFFGG